MNTSEIVEYWVLDEHNNIIEIFHSLGRAERFVRDELVTPRASSIYNSETGASKVLDPKGQRNFEELRPGIVSS